MSKNYSLTVKVVKTSKVNNNARNTDSVCCCGCHHTISNCIDGEEMNPICYAIEGLSGYAEEGKTAYMHAKCLEPLRYHASDRIENITGRPNVTDWRIGRTSIEIETVSLTRSTVSKPLITNTANSPAASVSNAF